MEEKNFLKALAMAAYMHDSDSVQNLAELFLLTYGDKINHLKGDKCRYFNTSNMIEYMITDRLIYPDIRVEPYDVDFGAVYYLYGNTLVETKKYEKAKDILLEAVYWSPAKCTYRFEYAEALRGCNDWSEYLNQTLLCGKYSSDSKSFARYLRNLGFYNIEIDQDYQIALGLYFISLIYDYSRVALSEIEYIGHEKMGLSGSVIESLDNEEILSYTQKAKDKYRTNAFDDMIELLIDQLNEARDNNRTAIAKYILDIMLDLKIIDKGEYDTLFHE